MLFECFVKCSFCRAAEEIDFLSHDARAEHSEGQRGLQQYVRELIASTSKSSLSTLDESQDSERPNELPNTNIVISGGGFQRVDFSDYLQGHQMM